MTTKELAEMLSGREVGMEITSVEFDRAADAGLVVVYGYSDDNVEFRGPLMMKLGLTRALPFILPLTESSRSRTAVRRIAPISSRSGKRPKALRQCGTTRVTLAGRLRLTYPMKRSTFMKTETCSVWVLCSVWRIWYE